MGSGRQTGERHITVGIDCPRRTAIDGKRDHPLRRLAGFEGADGLLADKHAAVGTGSHTDGQGRCALRYGGSGKRHDERCGQTNEDEYR